MPEEVRLRTPTPKKHKQNMGHMFYLNVVFWVCVFFILALPKMKGLVANQPVFREEQMQSVMT